jgi:hypothetical protein
MRARRALMQSAEALHGEDWLLVRISLSLYLSLCVRVCLLARVCMLVISATFFVCALSSWFQVANE